MKPLSPMKLKAIALASFEAALADPSADWKAVAEAMAAAMATKPKASTDPDAPPSWWRCDKFGKSAHKTVVECVFTDGRTIRANVSTDPGKPYNVGRGVKIAVAFYRAKLQDERCAVPELKRVTCLDSGESFDAAECSRMTAAWREFQMPPDTTPNPEAVAMRIAAVEAELERRRESRRLNRWLAIREAGAMMANGIAGYGDLLRTFVIVDDDWAAAIQAGERELAKLLEHPARINADDSEPLEPAYPVDDDDDAPPIRAPLADDEPGPRRMRVPSHLLSGTSAASIGAWARAVASF